MTKSDLTIDDLAQHVLATPCAGRRRLVALVGAPASGKSTLAEALAKRLIQQGQKTVVVPMDGFHLDNSVLRTNGLLSRKGAPETFDLAGLSRLISSVAREEEVHFPVFDRDRDTTIADAGLVAAAHETVIVEGNYLLLDEPGWRDLASMWDLSIRLVVPHHELRRRLIDRWVSHGLTEAEALVRAEGNDLDNAARIEAAMLQSDLLCSGAGL